MKADVLRHAMTRTIHRNPARRIDQLAKLLTRQQDSIRPPQTLERRTRPATGRHPIRAPPRHTPLTAVYRKPRRHITRLPQQHRTRRQTRRRLGSSSDTAATTIAGAMSASVTTAADILAKRNMLDPLAQFPAPVNHFFGTRGRQLESYVRPGRRGRSHVYCDATTTTTTTTTTPNYRVRRKWMTRLVLVRPPALAMALRT